MSTKRYRELKNLSKDELKAKSNELEAGLFQAKMKKVTGQLEDVSSLWRLRKDLARVKMLHSQAEQTQGSAK